MQKQTVKIETRAANPSDWRAVTRQLCGLVAGSRFVIGVLYTYAKSVIPMTIGPRVTFNQRALTSYLEALKRGCASYAAVFVLFTVTDTSLLLLGLALRRLFDRDDLRGNLACACIVVAMFLGIAADVSLLSHWLVMGEFGSAVSPAAKAGFWVANVEL